MSWTTGDEEYIRHHLALMQPTATDFWPSTALAVDKEVAVLLSVLITTFVFQWWVDVFQDFQHFGQIQAVYVVKWSSGHFPSTT